MREPFEFESTVDGPRLVGSSPSRLGELLDELEIEIDRAGLSFRSHFRPGISPHEVRERLGEQELVASEELCVWFGWQGGPFDDGAPGIFPNFIPASIDRALADRSHLNAGVAVDVLDSYGLSGRWLSLGMSTVGLAVECSKPVATPRIRYASEDFGFEPTGFRAVSLCTFVAWRLYGIATGGFEWSPATGMWIGDSARLHPSQVEATFW